ncbi:hypothetical protein FZC84_01050 [Rossellomorea vietnamensis]|uniref:Uncharacterized protein n=1 Tax=Rossellomorea vietnamensis TaxID=218284 RepID=A0A5D4MHA8_9BACI|nr:hypothetical protein [Rossellomorea vietnamensis]TYS01275.1 hypothetical protein FZC84_01050 [Rossellomorea vietnamensis]
MKSDYFSIEFSSNEKEANQQARYCELKAGDQLYLTKNRTAVQEYYRGMAAVVLMNKEGRVIGSLPKELEEKYTGRIDQGESYKAKVIGYENMENFIFGVGHKWACHLRIVKNEEQTEPPLKEFDFIQKHQKEIKQELSGVTLEDRFFIRAEMKVESDTGHGMYRAEPLDELQLSDGNQLLGERLRGSIQTELIGEIPFLQKNLTPAKIYLGTARRSFQVPSQEEIDAKLYDIYEAYNCTSSEKIREWLYGHNTEYRTQVQAAKKQETYTYYELYISNLMREELEKATGFVPVTADEDQKNRNFAGILLTGTTIETAKFADDKKDLEVRLFRETKRLNASDPGGSDFRNSLIIPLEVQKETFFITIHHYVYRHPFNQNQYKYGKTRFRISADFKEAVTAYEDLKKEASVMGNSYQTDYGLVLDSSLDIIYTDSTYAKYCPSCKDFVYPVRQTEKNSIDLRIINQFVKERQMLLSITDYISFSKAEFRCPDCSGILKDVSSVFGKPVRKPVYAGYEDEYEYELSEEEKMEAQERTMQKEVEWVTEQNQTIYDRSPFDYDDE